MKSKIIAKSKSARRVFIKKAKTPLSRKITRNNLEQKVRQQTDELKIRDELLSQGMSREKFAEEQVYIRTKAIESTFDGIFIIDALKPDYPIVYANPSFYNLTGYSKSDVIGKNYFLLYGTNVNLHVYEEIKKNLREGKSFQGEMLNSKKNGEKFWSLLRITLVRDKSGIVTHFVGNKTNTTLMKQRDFEIAEQRESFCMSQG